MENYEKLITRARQDSDQDAITQLYYMTFNKVYYTVITMIKDEYTARDIVQESYIKGFQKLYQLEKPESFPAWIRKIAINNTKNYLKKKKPVLFTDMTAKEDDTPIDFEEERIEYLPEESMDQKETSRLINEILDCLTDEQRIVIGMYYYQHLKIKEISKELEISENTVKSRLRYAKQKIEIKVKELEKNGTKLYSLSPIAFFVWLLQIIDQDGIPADNMVSSKMIDQIIERIRINDTGIQTKQMLSKKQQAVHNTSNAVKGTSIKKSAITIAGRTITKKTLSVLIAGIIGIGAAGSGVAYMSSNSHTDISSTVEASSEESTTNYNINDYTGSYLNADISGYIELNTDSGKLNIQCFTVSNDDAEGITDIEKITSYTYDTYQIEQNTLIAKGESGTDRFEFSENNELNIKLEENEQYNGLYTSEINKTQLYTILYQKYLDEEIDTGEYYKIVSIGKEDLPVLLIGTEESYASGEYASADLYYVSDGKVEYISELAGGMPMQLIEKNGNRYLWAGLSHGVDSFVYLDNDDIYQDDYYYELTENIEDSYYYYRSINGQESENGDIDKEIYEKEVSYTPIEELKFDKN